MHYRELGRTGLSISELTFGTSALERIAADEGVGVLQYAFENGVNAVEFASDGAAEQRLAKVTGDKGAAREVHLLSRLRSRVRFDLPSPHIPAFAAYPGGHVRTQTEASLKVLGVERLACQQIHAWCPEWLGEGDWLEVLQRLKEEGKIAAIGVSLFDHDVDASTELVTSGAVDCIQLMFNIFDQGAACALFRLCEQHGVGVIARAPLYFGALSRRVHQAQPFAEDEWRSDYFYPDQLAEVRERVARIERDLPSEAIEDAALRFCLSHAAVSTVAVGMSSKEQVEANLLSAERGPLDHRQITRLRQHRWLC